MNTATILALVAQLTDLGIKLYAEHNRDATPDEVAALDAAFAASKDRLAQSIAAREAGG